MHFADVLLKIAKASHICIKTHPFFYCFNYINFEQTAVSNIIASCNKTVGKILGTGH